jgi:hypothetical protein
MVNKSLFFCFLALPAAAQFKPPACSAYRKGTFYAYPSGKGIHYILYRDAHTEKEVSPEQGDSTVWRIEWQDACNYTLEYVSGNVSLSGKQEKFLEKHRLAYRILFTTDDYCVYTEAVDKPDGKLLERDTIWLHESPHVLAAPNPGRLVDEMTLRKRHFSDTSQYAVLCLYRPKKLVLSLARYGIFLDSSALCMMTNGSAYMFMISKEGPATLESVLNKDKFPLALDIKFGRRYYVRSTIDWGLTKYGNYKLEMEQVPEAKAKQEFEQVQ